MRILCVFICILYIVNCSGQQHSIGISPYTAFISFRPNSGTYPLEYSVDPNKNLSYGIKLRYNYTEKIAGFTAGLNYQFIPLDLQYNTMEYFADSNHGGSYSKRTYKTYCYQGNCSIMGLYAGFHLLLSEDDDENNRLFFSGIAQLNGVINYNECVDSVYIRTIYHSININPYYESNYTMESASENVIEINPPKVPFLSMQSGLNYRHAFKNSLELDVELMFNFQSLYPLHLLQIEKIKPFVHLGAGINYRFNTKNSK